MEQSTDGAAVLAAEAGETAQMREIATAITRLPVSQDDGPLTALEWVMDLGETEIEEVESIADIAAQLMGQEDARIEEETEHGLQDANNLEPQCVSVDEAKQSISTLLQFIGDNIGLHMYSEEDYRLLLCLQEKMSRIQFV